MGPVRMAHGPYVLLGSPEIMVFHENVGWARLTDTCPQGERGWAFGNLDEVYGGGCHSPIPLPLPRGQVERGHLIITMTMLKIDNNNAHIYWVPPGCQGVS